MQLFWGSHIWFMAFYSSSHSQQSEKVKFRQTIETNRQNWCIILPFEFCRLYIELRSLAGTKSYQFFYVWEKTPGTIQSKKFMGMASFTLAEIVLNHLCRFVNLPFWMWTYSNRLWRPGRILSTWHLSVLAGEFISGERIVINSVFI